MPVVAKPTLTQAVIALYDSVGAGTPTLYLDEVPEANAGYPRAVLSMSGEHPEQPGEINADGIPTISRQNFSITIIVENSSDTSETLALAVLNVFKPSAIQLIGNDNTTEVLDHTQRQWRTYGLRQRSPADKPLYATTVNYSAQYGTSY